ncbi:formate C-acetyltransferase/glycerol dehydratase family glycyl radical enzyme [Collinsella sp. AGMB00827]|uniref:Formate C-acetyltransferase/glycerol dehydratase family glycyl radical enzyme n=1 Tax=Collinsella ureilytica TaxID=2869515 RepID=A0ABS7MIL9_9ACTN|nr:formate C-acetyltransferase/glycerol dehydratase family glycyl radical enzyme [Collinsella urealyticum]MBY4797216.1 formate C-acetyltransferase/glycerol dehydratase family glycyl radical enzyme [Collinsella urealyticum]
MEAMAAERIQTLREHMLNEPRYASIEQAKIITESYQKHPNEPRILQRAHALAAALEQMEITIDPLELIVGNRTAGVRAGVVFPEAGSSWVDRELETLPSRPQDTFNVHEEDIEYFRRIIKPFWKDASLEDRIRIDHGEELKEIGRVAKINQTDHAQGHINPNCRTWLSKGPLGLKTEALSHLEMADSEKRPFYQAVVLVMDGAIAFMRRYAALARTLATSHPEAAEDLMQVATICDALAERPAKTFHEALQGLWFLFVILQMESNASSFSPGRLDMVLEPYYRTSISDGMSKDRALELIECLFLKFNQIVYMRSASSARYFAGFPIGFNIAVGGQDRTGANVENDLSYLFLQAQEELGLPQPNLSVRLHENTTDSLLKKAIRVVAKGSGMPQFFNDEAVVPALEELGVDPADALDYAIVGCVELTTQGDNLGWSDAAMFNLNKALELTLTGGVDLVTGRVLGPDFGSLDTYASYEELEASFAKMIDYYMDRMVEACAWVEAAHIDLLPTAFLSAVIDDCLERGIDVTAGGAHYNFSGIQMIQVANLADSLAALKMLVYDEQVVSAHEMLQALRDNFEGHEILHARILNKVPKYGNDVAWVDELGCRWAEYFQTRLRSFTNYRGGPYHTGMYTVSAHVPMGENVGASPDGRLSQTPLADGGMSPMYGRDLDGPTAVLKSVARLDPSLTSNGGLLNMKFLPSFFATEQGIDKFALFLHSFVDLKIPHIQFNVVRREDLIAAQQDPERYRSLTVRVAGYTAYFTELAGKLQDEIIARTSYADMS